MADGVDRVVKIVLVTAIGLRIRPHRRQPFDRVDITRPKDDAVAFTYVTSDQRSLPNGVSAHHGQSSSALAALPAASFIQSSADAFFRNIRRRCLNRGIKSEIVLSSEVLNRNAKLSFHLTVAHTQT